MSELGRFIEQQARLRELLVYHVPDSRAVTGRGFPDWVIAGPGGMLFAEDKAPGETLLPEQRQWWDALRVLPFVFAFVWWDSPQTREAIKYQLDRCAGLT